MNSHPSSIRRTLAAAVATFLLTAPGFDAKGGHGGGHGSRAPRVSAARGYTAPRMPRAMASPRGGAGAGRYRNNSNIAYPHAASTGAGNNSARALSNRAASTNAGLNTSRTVNRTTAGSIANPGTAGSTGLLGSGLRPNSYTYGYGSGARSYRPYGYGSGYRNRYYGGNYGYGRSQGYSRAIVSRLRSVHANLARIDHDYQGHRARAAQQVSMAIRQLSHRSMYYRGSGFNSGMNNGQGMGMGMRRMGGNGGGGGRGGMRMSQAQSDARMSQALRTLQGIGMQLNNQGNSTMGHGRASGHIQYAIHELNVALSVR
jgi:hypothetical protein